MSFSQTEMPAHSVSRKMDSSESKSENNENEEPLTPARFRARLRERTNSEGSDRQTRFILPCCEGGPPKIVTIDEIAEVMKNIKNMNLVHEIALNPEFKLKPYEPPENSLEGRIRKLMHKAFWDILRKQLNEHPPCFENAKQLLSDIKECFPQIISASNKRLLDYINEVLDETIIQQQAEHGVLDFKAYANFMIEIMAKSCAPFRDEEVSQLRDIVDVVDTLRGILETMAVMKLDMANCLLDFARNDLLANSIEYEKEKFKEYLEFSECGFPATDRWLQRSQTRSQEIYGSANPEQVIFNAYMELLDWNEEHEFPEILSIDKDRIHKLSSRTLRLCIGACTIAISSTIPIISQRPENRESLAREIEVLLLNVDNNNDLAETMKNVALHVDKIIKSRLEEKRQPQMDPAVENTLKSQIMQLAKKDSLVRNLIWNRLRVFFRLVLRSKTGTPPPPPGFVDFKEELENLSAAFRRLHAYTYSIFEEYFLNVLADNEGKVTQHRQKLPPPTTDQDEGTTNEKSTDA